ncbi:MAG: thermonuclease family protein [Hyphomicrobiaceae bacterium]
MFRWKKRDEGFEWREYVRTTIKLRRDARREKAEILGQQAAEKARKAGAMAENLARDGARKAGSAARNSAVHMGHLARSAAIGLGDLLVALFGVLGLLAGHCANAAARVLAALADIVGRPGVAGPLVFVGCIAMLGGLARLVFTSRGLDSDAITALAIGTVCLALGLLPAIMLGHRKLPLPRFRLPTPGFKLGTQGSIAIGGAAILAIGAGTVMLSGTSLPLPSAPSLASLTPFSSTETIEGGAHAIAGGIIRVDNSIVRLDGIEAPEPGQRCRRTNGRSCRCGRDARNATARLVRGHKVTCKVGSADAHGIRTGTCTERSRDIGEALVKNGNAFSEKGFMARYADAESAARKARSGIWRATEPERPSAWRNRLWETASKSAPDGCPIKGSIRRGHRVYLLPWSSRYDREKVSKRRGERWFCSEADAIAAGWRGADPG